MPEFALEEGQQVGDHDAELLAVEQLVHRQTAASFVRPDHDLVDLLALGPGAQRNRRRDNEVVRHRDGFPFARDETDDDESAPVSAAAHATHDQRGARTGTEDQYATLERIDVDETQEQPVEDATKTNPTSSARANNPRPSRTCGTM